MSIIFLFSTLAVFAQLPNDSLQKILDKAHDTTKIRMLFEWSESCASEEINQFTTPGLELTVHSIR